MKPHPLLFKLVVLLTLAFTLSSRDVWGDEARPLPLIGLNLPYLPLQFQGMISSEQWPTPNPARKAVLRRLGEKTIKDARNMNVGYVRIATSGFFPIHLRDWIDPQTQTAYWEHMDEMMGLLRSNNLKIVPVWLWNPYQFASLGGEDVVTMFSDQESISYRLLEAYMTEFIGRYTKDIYFHEATNELNLSADVDAWTPSLQRWGENSVRNAGIANFTSEQMMSFLSRLVALIRKLDGGRQISSGFALPRADAKHLRSQPWSSNLLKDSLDEFMENLWYTHEPFDLVSVHLYPGDLERFGFQEADFVSLIDESVLRWNKKLFIGEFGDFYPERDCTMSQKILGISQLRNIYATAWVYELYQHNQYETTSLFNIGPGQKMVGNIIQANPPYRAIMPEDSLADTAPPTVVITYPLNEKSMPCNMQQISVAASDDSQPHRLGVAYVDFYLDDRFFSRDKEYPYRLSLEGSLSPGTHKVRVVAVDFSGNTTEESIEFSASFCEPLPTADDPYASPRRWILDNSEQGAHKLN